MFSAPGRCLFTLGTTSFTTMPSVSFWSTGQMRVANSFIVVALKGLRGPIGMANAAPRGHLEALKAPKGPR